MRNSKFLLLGCFFIALLLTGCGAAIIKDGLRVPQPHETSTVRPDPVAIFMQQAAACAEEKVATSGYPLLTTCVTGVYDYSNRSQNYDGKGSGGVVPAKHGMVAVAALEAMGAPVTLRTEEFANIIQELKLKAEGVLQTDTNVRRVLVPFEICFYGQFTSIGLVLGESGRIAIGGVGIKGNVVGARLEGDFAAYTVDGKNRISVSVNKDMVSTIIGGDVGRFLPFPNPINLLLLDVELSKGYRDDPGIVSRLETWLGMFAGYTEFYGVYECDQYTKGAFNRTPRRGPPPVARYLEDIRRQPPTVAVALAPPPPQPTLRTRTKVEYLRSPAGKVEVDPKHQHKIAAIRDDVARGCVIEEVIGFTCPKGEPGANARLREDRSKHHASLLPVGPDTEIRAATDIELRRLHDKPEWDNEHGSFIKMKCSVNSNTPNS